MRALTGNHATEDVIKARWLTLLPSHVQNILKIFKTDSTENLLVTADQLMESPVVLGISAVHEAALHSNFGSDGSSLDEIKLLLSQLITLTRESIGRRSEGSSSQRSSCSRSPGVNRSRSPNHRRSFRGRPQSPHLASGLCRFHQRFGFRAYKCIQPCSYETSSSMSSQGNM